MTPKKRKDNNLITANELAAATEESYDTIDHWTDKGLLLYTRRGNKRYFRPDTSIARCKKIRELQAEGLTLPQILKQLPKSDG